MNSEQLKNLVLETLENSKGRDIQVLDVRNNCDFTDYMVIVTGTSTTHVKAMGEAVSTDAKHAGHPPLGVEAPQDPEWVLVDLGDVIVHVMTERSRAFYALEKLWSVSLSREEESEFE
jgi:ribosome-associated protein